MSSKYNIVLNKTLEEYNLRYKKRRNKLLKYSKKEVLAYDKENHRYKHIDNSNKIEYESYLLKGKKWWLINDTYYQVPRPISLTWYRNLKLGYQIGLGVLVSLVPITSISLPVTFSIINNQVILNPEYKDLVNMTYSKDDKYIVIVLSSKDESKQINDVTLNKSKYKLDKTNDYIYEESKQTITVNRSNINKYFGPLVVTPSMIDKSSIIDLTYNQAKKLYDSKSINLLKDNTYTLNISLDNEHETEYFGASNPGASYTALDLKKWVYKDSIKVKYNSSPLETEIDNSIIYFSKTKESYKTGNMYVTFKANNNIEVVFYTNSDI